MPAARHLATVLTWLLLIGVAAFDVAVLAGGRHPAAVTALAAFSVPALAAAAVGVVASCLLRRRALVAAALLVAGPPVLIGLPPTWHASPRRSACTGGPPWQETLTAMTVNVEMGEGSPARVAALVRAHGVDLLAVQELTPAAAQALDALLTPVLPHHHLLSRGGAAGTGIWASAPLQPLSSLSSTTFAGPRASMRLGRSHVDVTVVHPVSPGPTSYSLWAREQRDLADELARLDDGGPRLVLGDFNAGDGHAPFRRLLDVARLDEAADLAGAWPGLTWPADRRLPPLTRIDHVLVTAHFTASAVTTHPVAGTDHRAVIAVLEPGVCR